MSVYCDVCTKALSPDKATYYGGGAYCNEHAPEEAESYCGECQAHLEFFQAVTITESRALEILTGPALDISQRTVDLSVVELQNVRDYMTRLADRAVDSAEYIELLLGQKYVENAMEAVIELAKVTGRAAFQEGKMRAPYMDENVQYMLKTNDPPYHEAIFTNWLAGWDQANLDSTKEQPF